MGTSDDVGPATLSTHFRLEPQRLQGLLIRDPIICIVLALKTSIRLSPPQSVSPSSPFLRHMLSAPTTATSPGRQRGKPRRLPGSSPFASWDASADTWEDDGQSLFNTAAARPQHQITYLAPSLPAQVEDDESIPPTSLYFAQRKGSSYFSGAQETSSSASLTHTNSLTLSAKSKRQRTWPRPTDRELRSLGLMRIPPPGTVGIAIPIASSITGEHLYECSSSESLLGKLTQPRRTSSISDGSSLAHRLYHKRAALYGGSDLSFSDSSSSKPSLQTRTDTAEFREHQGALPNGGVIKDGTPVVSLPDEDDTPTGEERRKGPPPSFPEPLRDTGSLNPSWSAERTPMQLDSDLPIKSSKKTEASTRVKAYRTSRPKPSSPPAAHEPIVEFSEGWQESVNAERRILSEMALTSRFQTPDTHLSPSPWEQRKSDSTVSSEGKEGSKSLRSRRSSRDQGSGSTLNKLSFVQPVPSISRRPTLPQRPSFPQHKSSERKRNGDWKRPSLWRLASSDAAGRESRHHDLPEPEETDNMQRSKSAVLFRVPTGHGEIKREAKRPKHFRSISEVSPRSPKQRSLASLRSRNSDADHASEEQMIPDVVLTPPLAQLTDISEEVVYANPKRPSFWRRLVRSTSRRFHLDASPSPRDRPTGSPFRPILKRSPSSPGPPTYSPSPLSPLSSPPPVPPALPVPSSSPAYPSVMASPPSPVSNASATSPARCPKGNAPSNHSKWRPEFDMCFTPPASTRVEIDYNNNKTKTIRMMMDPDGPPSTPHSPHLMYVDAKNPWDDAALLAAHTRGQRRPSRALFGAMTPPKNPDEKDWTSAAVNKIFADGDEEEEDEPDHFMLFSIPEHLPGSPLCPLSPKHKSGGKGMCPYHGRGRSPMQARMAAAAGLATL